MNILQIWLSQVSEFPREFLDAVTAPQHQLGKKENNYWILKGGTNLTGYPPEFAQSAQSLNILMQHVRNREYTDLMIIDR